MPKSLIAAMLLGLCFAAAPLQAQCPAAPTLTSPADNATNLSTNVTLQWSGTPGTNGQFDIDLLKVGDTTPTRASSSSTTFNPPTLQAGATYKWRVFPQGCESNSSPIRTFSTAASCPTTAPAQSSPAADAQFTEGDSITFSWFAVPGALKYEVLLATGTGPLVSAGETTDTSKTTTLPAATYRWAVRAIFSAACNTTSSQSAFRVNSANCPTTGPAQTAPANGTRVNPGTPITFTWSAISGATSYDLVTTDNHGATYRVAARTSSTSATLTPDAGTYEWFVAATFGGTCGAKRSASNWGFTVAAAPSCPTTAPTLIEPANLATPSSPVTFRWSAVPNAAGYKLYVSTSGDNFDLYGATTDTQLERQVSPGTIKWYVEAVAQDCAAVRSDTGIFTVTSQPACPFVTLTPIAPAQGATVGSPVTFSWSAVATASVYRVWMVKDGAPVLIARTGELQTTQSVPAGTFSWFVEALRDGCDTVVSARNTFTVQTGANCANNTAPTLISPAGTEASPAQATNSVDLRWNAAPNAIAYRVWVARDDQPPADLALTRDTHLERTLPAGRYAWFIEALFEACESRRSTTAHFVIEATTPACSGAAPTILSPASGSSATAPVTFSWTPVADAIEYRLYAAFNDSQPYLLGTTDETSMTRPVPPGTITWSVEAVFRRCPSTSSPRATFTLPQSVNCTNPAPILLSPANGATDVDSPVDFTWQAVGGAIRYVLVIEVDDGNPTAIGETNETHLTRNVPQGKIEWWVVAFFNGCEPAKSDEFAFRTKLPAQCDTRAAVLLAPPNLAAEVTSPLLLAWSPVANASGYKVWAERRGDADDHVIATTTSPFVKVDLQPGTYEWFVQTLFDGCPTTESSRAIFRVVPQPQGCAAPEAPIAFAPGQVLSNTEYNVRWLPLPRVSGYEVQEATAADFSDATTRTTDEPFAQFSHVVSGAPVKYLYRIRGISACSDERGAYSDVVGTFVVASRDSGNERNASVDISAQGSVVQTIQLPPQNPPVAFTATADKPWITITPSSGTVGAEGLTLTVSSNPAALALGTTTGTVKITYASSGKGTTTNGTTPVSYPVSISLVTPVSPTGKGTPPLDALIIPAVAHATGANDSFFESDVRITNLAATTMKYAVNFTPSNSDGTQSGSSTTVEIAPNATLALDDILASFFGSGTTTGALGLLEIRPLTTSSTSSKGLVSTVTPAAQQLLTIGSSRTFNSTPTGTFGQYVPAIPYAQFAGKNQTLSLQQIAQSAAYRTNFGFAEGSGQPADLRIRVFDTQNQLLGEFTEALKAGEHKQINQMLALHGITDLADGRVEVQVTSDTGKITAYASTLDNTTSDPLLVSPVQTAAVSASRWVIPGVAYLNNGLANWRTDVRLFNAAATETTATLTYYPQGNPTGAIARDVQIAAGEIKVLDNILPSTFGVTDLNAGGSIAVATSKTTSFVATARTYNQTSSGTYGQFIPGVTPAEATGFGERALHVLQLEQSTRFRTNIGLAETNGGAATVEVSVALPDSKITPVLTVPLAANEFRQISLASFGIEDAIYNARVTVKVVSGTGRVTAYGSVIDMITQDPTYVPAQ